MKHPVEELFEKMYASQEERKAIDAILRGLNRAWKTNSDVDVKEVTKGDLRKMLSLHPDLNNPALIEELLELVIAIFNDPETLRIVMNNLNDKDRDQWATILAGLYGKKARRAIPWIRYHIGGDSFPDEAHLALRHIGMSQKILYTGLRIAIREKDPDNIFFLSQIMQSEYPGYETDPKFVMIMNRASRSKNIHMRCAAIGVLSIMPTDIRSQFDDILQRLVNDRDDGVKEMASKLVNTGKL